MVALDRLHPLMLIYPVLVPSLIIYTTPKSIPSSVAFVGSSSESCRLIYLLAYDIEYYFFKSQHYFPTALKFLKLFDLKKMRGTLKWLYACTKLHRNQPKNVRTGLFKPKTVSRSGHVTHWFLKGTVKPQNSVTKLDMLTETDLWLTRTKGGRKTTTA